MVAGESADTMRTKELILIEHPRKDAAQFLLIDDGEQPPARKAGASPAYEGSPPARDVA